MLSLVNAQAGHGYSVYRRFVQVYAGLFTSPASEVYKALDRLEGEGLIEAVESPPDDRADVHYGSTLAGARALSAWLGGAVDEADSARGTLVRMRATSDLETLNRLLDMYEDIVQDQLTRAPLGHNDRAGVWQRRRHRLWWSAELEWVFWMRAQLCNVGEAAVQSGR